MSYQFSIFRPFLKVSHPYVCTLKHSANTCSYRLTQSRLENEKSLTILPTSFPATAFKVSGVPLPVDITKDFNKSQMHFKSPMAPSLRELRVLLGIMRLAIKSCYKNEFDEGGELMTTLSELKEAAAIGSNLNVIKSSLLILSQISFSVGGDEHFLLVTDQFSERESRITELSLELHPIFTRAVLSFVKRKELTTPTFYSIYYIQDLQALNTGLGAKSAQALYIYYSSTLSQGSKSFQHSKNTLCEKIYNLNGKVNGGHRRKLIQGIWRLAEVGWLVTMPSQDIYIVSRPKRHSVQKPKKINKARSKRRINNYFGNKFNQTKRRPPIVSALKAIS